MFPKSEICKIAWSVHSEWTHIKITGLETCRVERCGTPIYLLMGWKLRFTRNGPPKSPRAVSWLLSRRVSKSHDFLREPYREPKKCSRQNVHSKPVVNPRTHREPSGRRKTWCQETLGHLSQGTGWYLASWSCLCSAVLGHFKTPPDPKRGYKKTQIPKKS